MGSIIEMPAVWTSILRSPKTQVPPARHVYRSASTVATGLTRKSNLTPQTEVPPARHVDRGARHVYRGASGANTDASGLAQKPILTPKTEVPPARHVYRGPSGANTEASGLLWKSIMEPKPTFDWSVEWKSTVTPMAELPPARHLYRSLLRAVSYLPDSFARTILSVYIKKRFQAKQTQIGSRHIPRLKKAIAWRRRIERASQGSLEDLQKILLLAYGREGFRRRQLIKDLIRPDEDKSPETDQLLENLVSKPDGKCASKFTPSPKVEQFIQSQRRNHPAETRIPTIKALKVPNETIWGRQVPNKQETRLRRKWWAATLEKILPPVPESEWDRLRDLSLGEIPLEKPPKLRKRVTSAETESDKQSLREKNMKEYFRRLEEGFNAADAFMKQLDNKSDKEKALFKFCKEKALFQFLQTRPKIKDVENWGANYDSWGEAASKMKNLMMKDMKKPDEKLDNRAIRRVYASVWCLTSKMVQEENTKSWDIQWGIGRTQFLAGAVTTPSASDKELFEGLET